MADNFVSCNLHRWLRDSKLPRHHQCWLLQSSMLCVAATAVATVAAVAVALATTVVAALAVAALATRCARLVSLYSRGSERHFCSGGEDI